MTSREHFVEFMSPGLMFDETTERSVSSWDIGEAMKIAMEIRERHGARPYGFRFSTRIVSDGVPDGEGGLLKVQPKTVATSGTHYIAGVLLTYDDVKSRNNRDDSTLLFNMRCNGWWICCETRNGYRHTGMFAEKDVLVEHDGAVIDRGDDPKHVEYRKKKDAEKAAETP